MTSEEEAVKKQVERLEKEMEYITKELSEARAILDGFKWLCRVLLSKIITFRCDIRRIEQEREKERKKKEEEKRKIEEAKAAEELAKEKRRIDEVMRECERNARGGRARLKALHSCVPNVIL